jgi:hypothetical protein
MLLFSSTTTLPEVLLNSGKLLAPFEGLKTRKVVKSFTVIVSDYVGYQGTGVPSMFKLIVVRKV